MQLSIVIYKIRKIVWALWLAKRSVCMRVWKHGRGIKMYWFSRANHVSTNLKKFSGSKLDKFTLFTHSFVSWNLENLYKQAVSIFFHLSWHTRVSRFFLGMLFDKNSRILFSCVCIAWYKHSRGWENSQWLYKPSTSSRVGINCLEFSTPSRVYIRLCKRGKHFLLLKYYPST